MRAIIWFLAILYVSMSCDQSPGDSCEESDLNPSKKIVVIKGLDSENQFYYDCNKLIKTKYVPYNIIYSGVESSQEFKYVDDLISEVSGYYGPTTFSYNGGQLTDLSWPGFGRWPSGSCKIKYNSDGKVDSLIGYSFSPAMQVTVRTKFVWSGDNVEKRIKERESWNKGFLTVTYDTVDYEYGDELNPFYENIYSGYTFQRLSYGEAELAPDLSKNVLLKKSTQGGQFFALYQYEFDQENSPVKITETGTSPAQSSYVSVTEIEYD